MRKKILYAVLNWGLGHSTRSLPIIRELIKNNEVVILSTGRSLMLLKSEFPEIEVIDYPDYSIKYVNNANFLFLSLAFQLPKILLGLWKENSFTDRLVKEKNIDIIISDNRYGVYSKGIPSYLITHQLKFKLPAVLKWFEFLSEYFNKFYFSKFKKILIPDLEGEPNFSGELSHEFSLIDRSKLEYIGLLSDTMNCESLSSDYLVLISGPEPQRTNFEKIISEQIKHIEGKKTVILGKTEINSYESNNDIEYYSHLPRNKISGMIKGAGMIISRPGYSTVMEIAAMGKKALFIPTPGQTEQEYLARYYKKNKLFHYVTQKDLNLKTDIHEAQKYDEIPKQKVNDIGNIIKLIMEN
ncbi:MAG: hypothetical protein JXR69_05430 [Candidatus Delongbacteria bacterium]|nr:hypothetical protein [Candidatus Delongbacteria bacterium]